MTSTFETTPTDTDLATLSDAWLHAQARGPEYDGYLSNHAPMVVEALQRHGLAEEIEPWLTTYGSRLHQPLPTADPLPLAEREEALGDRGRLPSWIATFEREVAERGWQEVLGVWWPRLLPGLAGAATHPIIRVGHVTRALRDRRVDLAVGERELAHALGYWAAAWMPAPTAGVPLGPEPRAALDAVAPIARDRGGLGERFAALAAEERPLGPAAWVPTPEEVPDLLRRLVEANVRRYPQAAGGNAVMVVHASTASNAVLRTLPSVPREWWPLSAAAAWAASATLHAVYPVRAGWTPPPVERPDDVRDAFALAARHGDEHVIKFADTALDVAAWTGDPTIADSIATAVRLIDPLER